MRKFVLALAAVSMLAAGQAGAKGTTAAVRVGDRVGAPAAQTNQLGDFGLGVIPTLLISAAVIAVVIDVAGNNSPTSP